MGRSRVPRGRGRIVSRVLGLTLALALTTTVTSAAVAATGTSTFSAAVRSGNCTVTATGSWSDVHMRVHQVTFTLTTNSPTYPATVGSGAENAALDTASGTESLTFYVTRADTSASIRADFYSFNGTLLGSASSSAVRVACT